MRDAPMTSTTSGQHHVEPRRSRAHGAKKPPAQKTRPPEPPAAQQTAPGLVPPATWGGGEHAVVEVRPTSDQDSDHNRTKAGRAGQEGPQRQEAPGGNRARGMETDGEEEEDQGGGQG